MFLPVLLISLCVTFAESLYEGDLCSLSAGGSGVCTLLNHCPPVLEELKVGILPSTVCGYSGFAAIVCCPKNTLVATATSVPEAAVNDGRGEISRQKCTEYSRYVYTLMRAPTLNYNAPLVNVSLCGIKGNSWTGFTRNAYPREFPHMAAVGYDLENGHVGWYCGGTLISENFVLTAAHCIYSRNWGNATWVRLGDLNLEQSDDGAKPIDLRIAEHIKHPEFKPNSKYHDIALLRLESAVSFNGWIRPACLHTAPSTGIDTRRAIATAWSYNESKHEVPSDLRMDTVSFIDTQACNAQRNSYGVDGTLGNGVVENLLICAAALGKVSNQRYSGGPLVIYNKNAYCMYDVIGVMNFEQFYVNQTIGIYTRVYRYLPWLESIVWGQG